MIVKVVKARGRGKITACNSQKRHKEGLPKNMCRLPRPALDGTLSILNEVPDIFPLLEELFFHSGRLNVALKCLKKNTLVASPPGFKVPTVAFPAHWP